MYNMIKNYKVTKNNILVKEINDELLIDNDKPKNVAAVLITSTKVKDITEGDVVFYSKFAGVNIFLNKEKYVLLSRNEIFGKINGTVDIEIGDTTDLIKMFNDAQVSYGEDCNKLNDFIL